MANYSQLKAAIADVIKTNGTQAITGQVLQDVLNSMVSVIGANYTFAGVATPSTNPGTPDQNVAYMASQAGTYTNFGGVELPAGISLLMWNGSWTSQIFFKVDDVYDYINTINLNDYDLVQAAPNPNLWIYQNINYEYYGKFIQIPNNTKKIQITSNPNKVTKYALLQNNQHIANSQVNYATGESYKTLNAGETVTLTDLPSNAKYLYVLVCLAQESSTGSQPAYNEPQSIIFIANEKEMNVGNSYQGDYEIKDSNGNVLMRLKDGHIKTKKFDSSLGNFLLDKFIGKKIAIIGDSISTYSGWLPSDISEYDGAAYATYYPHGDVDNVTKTWWYKALRYLGLEPSTDLNNCSWSGSRVTGNSESTTSASAGCSTKRITDLSLRITTPDIVLVFIGCNDWGNEVAVGNWAVTDTVPSEGTISTFRPAFAVMLNKIHVTYPNARVFVCTILDDYKRDEIAGYPPENGNGVVTYQWNENIKEIAEAFGCDVIDMHNCGLTYSNMQYFCVDEGLHPNAAGMEMMARKVASELIAKY